MALPADASYLLSGGMGALGLVTAQALAEEGAKSLLLMSRRERLQTNPTTLCRCFLHHTEDSKIAKIATHTHTHIMI